MRTRPTVVGLQMEEGASKPRDVGRLQKVEKAEKHSLLESTEGTP